MVKESRGYNWTILKCSKSIILVYKKVYVMNILIYDLISVRRLNPKKKFNYARNCIINK